MSYPPRLVPFYKEKGLFLQRHDCSYRVSLNELLATLPDDVRNLIGESPRHSESIFHLSLNRLVGPEMVLCKNRIYDVGGFHRRYGPNAPTKRVIGVSIRQAHGKFVVVLRTEGDDLRPDVDVDLSLLPETAPPEIVSPPPPPRYSTSISSSTRGYFTTVGLNYFHTR